MPDEHKHPWFARLHPTVGHALRGGVRRYLLPGVVITSMAAGIGFGSLSISAPDSGTTHALEAVPAAPAAEAPAERAPDQASRDNAREPIASPMPEPTPEQTRPAAVKPSAVEPSPVEVKKATPRHNAKATGKRVAQENLNVRNRPSAEAEKIASVAQGESVSITAKSQGEWQQILVKGRTGWVLGKYLEKEGQRAPAAPAKQGLAAQPAAASGGAAKRSCAPLSGLTANAEKVHQASCARFPGVSSYLGVRPDWDSEHPSGRAVDIMVSSTGYGQQIADYMRANAGSLGVTEVIFNQRIWTTQRASEGWRSMGNRGSATANHQDHVHVSVR